MNPACFAVTRNGGKQAKARRRDSKVFSSSFCNSKQTQIFSTEVKREKNPTHSTNQEVMKEKQERMRAKEISDVKKNKKKLTNERGQARTASVVLHLEIKKLHSSKHWCLWRAGSVEPASVYCEQFSHAGQYAICLGYQCKQLSFSRNGKTS